MYKIATTFLLYVMIWGGVAAQQTMHFDDPEAVYQKALQLFLNKKYSASKALMDDYISKTTPSKTLQSSTAKYYSALCALYLDNPTAEKDLSYFSKNNSEHAMAPFAYYELGKYYYDQKKYDNAIAAFEEVDAELLSEDQKNEMRFKLAYSYFSQKKFQESRRLFDRIKAHRHQYQSAAYYYAGYIAFEQEDYSAAYSDFKSIADDPQYNKVVQPNILKILYKQEKYKELIAFAEEKNIKSGESSLYLAEAYFFQNDYENANVHYEKYFSRTKSADHAVMYRMGYTQLINKNYEGAAEYLKKSALDDNELGQNSAYNLGICYLKMGRKDYALGAFIHASDLDFDPKIKEEALVSFAKLCYENKNYQDAIASLKRLNKEYPNSSHFKENEELLTDAYLNSSNYKMALDYLESISDKSHHDKIAYQNAAYNLGVKKYNNNEYKDALVYFEKSLKYPIDKDILLGASFWTAESYSIGKKFNEAIKFYSRIFENDPLKTSEYYLKARYGIAYAYYNTEQYDKASTHFRFYKLSEKQEKLYVVDATTRLADCYYVLRDYPSAIAEYKEVKKQEVLHHNYASFQLGIIEYLAGRTDEAKADLDEIIKEHKDSPYYDDALYQRALIDLETASYASAVAGFSDFIDFKPNNNLVPMAYSKRALAYASLAKPEKELADYLYILNHYTTHPVAYTVIQSLSSALTKVGRESEFSDYLNQYKKANPKTGDLEDVEFENAKVLYFAANYPSAINALEKYLTSYPSTAQAYEAKYYLADAYKKTDKTDKAIEWYEKVITDNKSDYVIRSMYRVAQLYYAKGEYEKAMQRYVMLGERAQGPLDITRSLEGQMKSGFNMENYELTRENAEKLKSSGFASEEMKEEAKLYAAKSALMMSKTNQAASEFTEIIKSNSGAVGAEANYLLAKIKFEASEHEQSIKILHNLNKTYAEHEYWVGKSYLLIARNLMAQNEDFQAKATLNSIIEYSKVEEVVKDAEILLVELNAEVEKEQADSTAVEEEHIINLKDE